MGAVNEVVDHALVERWRWNGPPDINGKSPQAMRMLKYSFNLVERRVGRSTDTRRRGDADSGVHGR